MNEAVQTFTYSDNVFQRVRSVNEAKAVILTNEGPGLDTDTRWRVETPYQLGLIEENCRKLTPNSVVLDYGCGIGRMAKALIDRFGCFVVGVDIAAPMRALAADYVGSDRFFACSPYALDLMTARGFKFDLAVSIWVLQHCQHLDQDIQRIHRALKETGELFVVNDHRRILPTSAGRWADDGQSISEALAELFDEVKSGEMDASVVGLAARGAFWATYYPSV